MEAFQANHRPGAEKLRVMNKHAQILLDDHLSANKDTSRPEIDRGPLQKILLDSLQAETIVWDSRFTSLSEQNGSWKLEFKNGASAYADLVIAAYEQQMRARASEAARTFLEATDAMHSPNAISVVIDTVS